MTVGHNRIGRNIREAIGHKLPAGTGFELSLDQVYAGIGFDDTL